MKPSEQTIQQIERALRKIAAKFPPEKEAEIMTDIHIRVSQDTGEIRAYNDDEEELDRCVVEEWINNILLDMERRPKAIQRAKRSMSRSAPSVASTSLLPLT